MAIDTSPSTVATNALQAIPFASLIGGPLDACIKAQAAAAKTSWEFIEQVGLTIDPLTGEKKAINITFQYNNNGTMTTLVVPLLVMVPIPYLAIDKVTIDFMANISAASSSVSETSSDTDLGVDATAEMALNIGPFSMKVNTSANYSSKQHSKASQDSSYSVEYTMGVHVEGGQADMPAGLGTILNILQGSISSVGPKDCMAIAPAALLFDETPDASISVTVKDNHAVLAPGAIVQLQFKDHADCFSVDVTRGKTKSRTVSHVLSGEPLPRAAKAFAKRYKNRLSNVDIVAKHQGNVLSATKQGFLAGPDKVFEGVTDDSGVVTFAIKLIKGIPAAIRGEILITADVPVSGAGSDSDNNVSPETQVVSYEIIPEPIKMTTPTQTVAFTAQSQEESLDVEVLQNTLAMQDYEVSVDVTANDGTDLSTIFDNITIDTTAQRSPITAKGDTGVNGGILFKFKTKAGISGKTVSGTIRISGSSNTVPLEVPFSVKIA